MGNRPSLYEDIKKLGKIVLITYIEIGERKAQKGNPEEIMKIYQKIKSDPEMSLVFIGPTE